MSNVRLVSRIITRILSMTSRGNIYTTPLDTLPRIHIDSYLISLGLLCQRFEGKGPGEKTFIKRSYQWLLFILEWFMLFKWVLSSTLPDDNPYLSSIALGDFTKYLDGDSFDYHFVLIIWSVAGAFMSTLFTLASGLGYMNIQWLRPFEICKGKVTPESLDMNVDEASETWQRLIFALWVTKTVNRILTMATIIAIVNIFANRWPEEHLYPVGIIWSVVIIIWAYYSISMHFTVMAIFHMICFYFLIKFRKLNELALKLETVHKLELMVMHKKVTDFMVTHNKYTRELTLYNKFWQFYVCKNFFINTTTICFLIQVIIFKDMTLFIRLLLLFSIFGFAFTLILTAFSAGAVSEQIHESYGVLNAVSQNHMPLVLKTQLQIYIQRIGGPKMGFSCWNLFTVFYDAFFQAILMVGSFFLLFMDVIQSEKKKIHYPYGYTN